MKSLVSAVLFALLLGWGSMSSPARAQSALERLEQQIRQRAAPTNTPPDADKPAPVPPAEIPHPPRNVEPGYLGIRADDQKDRGRGVRLIEVTPGSPAEKAGLLPQDLITAVAGVRVRQMTDMADILRTVAAGESLDVEVLRDGKPQKVRVTLGQYPAAERSSLRPETVPLPPGEALPKPPERRVDGVDGRRRVPPPPEPASRLKAADGASGPQLQPPGKNDRSSTDASRLDQLQRRVDELELRVAELERAIADSLQKKQP